MKFNIQGEPDEDDSPKFQKIPKKKPDRHAKPGEKDKSHRKPLKRGEPFNFPDSPTKWSTR